ncbi:MAG: hypothetical protein ABR874_22100 [Candidatus Sulfotelmatobacter sp.]
MKGRSFSRQINLSFCNPTPQSVLRSGENHTPFSQEPDEDARTVGESSRQESVRNSFRAAAESPCSIQAEDVRGGRGMLTGADFLRTPMGEDAEARRKFIEEDCEEI